MANLLSCGFDSVIASPYESHPAFKTILASISILLNNYAMDFGTGEELATFASV